MKVRLKSAQFKFGYLNECELDAHCGLAAYACFATICLSLFAPLATYTQLISHLPKSWRFLKKEGELKRYICIIKSAVEVGARLYLLDLSMRESRALTTD